MARVRPPAVAVPALRPGCHPDPGVLWAAWHAPFFASRYQMGGIGPLTGFFLSIAAGVGWLAFLSNSTGGSVLLVVLWHWSLNVVSLSAGVIAPLLVAVTSSLVIPVAAVALIAGGAAQLSTSATHAVPPVGS